MAVSLKITVKSQALVFDKTKVRQALRAAGNEVAAAARSSVRRSAGSGMFYYASGSTGKHGRYQASAPGPVACFGERAPGQIHQGIRQKQPSGRPAGEHPGLRALREGPGSRRARRRVHERRWTRKEGAAGA